MFFSMCKHIFLQHNSLDSYACQDTTTSDGPVCTEEFPDDVTPDPDCPTTYFVQNDPTSCFFTSPNYYTTGYTDNLCQGWVIRAADGADSILHLQFDDFDVSCATLAFI